VFFRYWSVHHPASQASSQPTTVLHTSGQWPVASCHIFYCPYRASGSSSGTYQYGATHPPVANQPIRRSLSPPRRPCPPYLHAILVPAAADAHLLKPTRGADPRSPVLRHHLTFSPVTASSSPARDYCSGLQLDGWADHGWARTRRVVKLFYVGTHLTTLHLRRYVCHGWMDSYQHKGCV